MKGHNGSDEMQASSPDSRGILGHNTGADEGHHGHSHKRRKRGRPLDCLWKLLIQPAAAEHGKDHHLPMPITDHRSEESRSLNDCLWKQLIQPAAAEHRKDHHLPMSGTARKSKDMRSLDDLCDHSSW